MSKIVLEIIIGIIIAGIGFAFNVCLYQLQKERYVKRLESRGKNGFKKDKRNG